MFELVAVWCQTAGVAFCITLNMPNLPLPGCISAGQMAMSQAVQQGFTPIGAGCKPQQPGNPAPIKIPLPNPKPGKAV